MILKRDDVKIVNLCPHPIKILGEDREAILLELPKTDKPCRIDTEVSQLGIFNGNLPVVKEKYTEVSNLPPEEEDTFYIVSRVVAQNVDRPDLLVMTDYVRDDNNRIIGATKLAFLG